MTTTKHTPGPWEIEETAGGPHGKFLSIGPGRGHPCVIQLVWSPRAINDEDLANARLIAAAPDLLAACVAVVEEDGFRGSALMRKRIDEMKAAIAKATTS